MCTPTIRRLVPAVLVWVAFGTAQLLGQSRLDSRAEAILSEIGRVRLLVVMSPPKPGEGPSSAYTEPAGFISRILGDRGTNVRQIAGLPVVVVETDRGGIGKLLDNPQITYVTADEPVPPLLHNSLETLRVHELHSRGVVGDAYSVAVLDTGVNYDHPLLRSKLRAEGCFSTAESTVYSVTSLCKNGLDVDLTDGAGRACNLPDCDHGTHVAGIAVGAQHTLANGDVISGVALGADLISIQVFTRFDDPRVCPSLDPCVRSFTSDQLEALQHVSRLSASHSIAAVNMSLGSGYHDMECDSTTPLSTEIEKLRESGILTVTGSGNNGYYNAVNSPACISGTIAVGASYKGRVELDHRYSNTSALVDFIAPSTEIVSSTNDGFEPKTGTSMAAAHISGLLALLKSQVPSASADALESHLRSTARRTVDPRTGLVLYFPSPQRALEELALTGDSSPTDSTREDVNIADFRGLVGALRIIVSSGLDAKDHGEVVAMITRSVGSQVVVRPVNSSTYSLENSAGFKLAELSRLAGALGPEARLYLDNLAAPD